MAEQNLKKEILNEAKRIHESAMYSAQNHFEYSKTWRSVDRWLGGLAALTAGIAGVGGLSQTFSAKVAGLIALIAAGVGSVAASLGAPKTKTQAYASANAYLALQQDARNFINIDIQLLNIDDARQQLAELVSRDQELNTTSEIPSRRAWKRAKKNVEGGSQEYEVDK